MGNMDVVYTVLLAVIQFAARECTLSTMLLFCSCYIGVTINTLEVCPYKYKTSIQLCWLVVCAVLLFFSILG